MRPLLQEQHRPARPGLSLRDDGELGRVDQRRVLGAVDEAGQVTIVPVRPARRFLDDRRDTGQLADRHPRDLEDDVVGAAGQPEDGVVLGRGHHETLRPGQGRVESLRACRRVVARDLAPQLGPEAGDEVDAFHGRARLAQRRDRSDELRPQRRIRRVELEIGVRRGPESENAGLRVIHAGRILPRAAV